ncbi:hypothetical protein VCR12J2_620252 [Vibrio coralliirubri]|nr:hypothetical protein VCR12J2_620252 [Vibrio coralliirubri]
MLIIVPNIVDKAYSIQSEYSPFLLDYRSATDYNKLNNRSNIDILPPEQLQLLSINL